MANALYAKAYQAFLSGDIDWATDTIKVVAVSDAHTADTATHQFLSSITAGHRMATSAAFGTKTLTSGVADAADITITPGPAAGNVKYFVIYKDTGVEGTSPLIACFDTTAGTTLPFAADSSDLIFQWDAGTNKIFKL